MEGAWKERERGRQVEKVVAEEEGEHGEEGGVVVPANVCSLSMLHNIIYGTYWPVNEMLCMYHNVVVLQQALL